MERTPSRDNTGATAAKRAAAAFASKDPAGLGREIRQHGMPWEQQYGYAQAVRVGNFIFVSGQVAHDEHGQLVAPAPLNDAGEIADASNMEAQMRQAYANAARLLDGFGASLANVVEETLYVRDVDAAFAAAGKVRKQLYGMDVPPVASHLIGTSRLAFPELLIEIRIVAMLP